MDNSPYLHKVQYYETDQMGFVHHSNYIRWFEEARVDFLDRVGMPYKDMEAENAFSPVVSAACRYCAPARFEDVAEIHLKITAYKGVRFTVGYRVLLHGDGRLLAEGKTTHCYINREGRPGSLKKENPALYEKMQELVGFALTKEGEKIDEK